MVPFSILWSGFAFFGAISTAIHSGFLCLIVLPFVIVGFYITIGRFIVKKRNKTHTCYAITNKRIIIYNDYRKKSISEIPLRNLSNVTYESDKNGIGSIHFLSVASSTFSLFNDMYGNTGMDILLGGNAPFALYDIHDAEKVYNLISNIH